jgi:hypothetical protein
MVGATTDGGLYHVVYDFYCTAQIGGLEPRGREMRRKLSDGDGVRGILGEIDAADFGGGGGHGQGGFEDGVCCSGNIAVCCCWAHGRRRLGVCVWSLCAVEDEGRHRQKPFPNCGEKSEKSRDVWDMKPEILKLVPNTTKNTIIRSTISSSSIAMTSVF